MAYKILTETMTYRVEDFTLLEEGWIFVENYKGTALWLPPQQVRKIIEA